MGLWDAAMFMEASRHGFQLELSRARVVQFAERLVLPNHTRGGHSGGGFVFARVATIRRVARCSSVRNHILVDGRDSRDAGLYFGEGSDSTRVANFADASDLPASAELLHLESNSPRDQRRLGELG